MNHVPSPSEPSKTTTAEAVLGVLSLRPMSGYEIRQMFERSTANFWSESYGQIYPTLKRLEAQGLIAAEAAEVPSASRASTCYGLTDAGRARLTTWLELPARTQVRRNELLLKLFFGALAGSAAMRAQVEAKRAECVAALARYTAIEAQTSVRNAQHPGLPYWRFTLRYGIAEARALIGWADETLAALDAMAAQTPAEPEKKKQRTSRKQAAPRRSEHAR